MNYEPACRQTGYQGEKALLSIKVSVSAAWQVLGNRELGNGKTGILDFG
jgi:hypothetical protein